MIPYFLTTFEAKVRIDFSNDKYVFNMSFRNGCVDKFSLTEKQVLEFQNETFAWGGAKIEAVNTFKNAIINAMQGHH